MRTIRLDWKQAMTLAIAFSGIFFAGVYSSAVPPLRGIVTPGGTSNSGTSPQYVSVVVNQGVNVPSFGSVAFGNVSTLGYRTVTMYIYVVQASCDLGNLFFNGYWKPDKTFPGLATAGLTSINARVGASVAVTSPVVGSQLSVYVVANGSTSCTVSGLWIRCTYNPRKASPQ